MNASRFLPPPQLALFDERTLDHPAKDGRLWLDATSWIEHRRGWLEAPEPLFAALAALDGWKRRSRWMFTRSVTEPRLTAEFHDLSSAPVDEVRSIGERLSEQYAVRYDSAWLNLYRDHQDSTSWHADRPAAERPTSVVPVLSLGASRRFQIRPRAGGRSTTFVVQAGDLLVMGGRCQRDWLHAVPKESHAAGPRISVNFGSGLEG